MSQADEDAERWGIQRAKSAPDRPQVFEVWPEHWEALQLFLGMRTQWRMLAGMTGARYQGLDYAVLYGHPRYVHLEPDEQLERLEQVQHIEVGALEALNDKA